MDVEQRDAGETTAQNDQHRTGATTAGQHHFGEATVDWQTTRYTYQRLPSATSIRLIKICERFLFDLEKTVSVEIETVELAQAPRYCALSYTWGNPRTLYQSTEQVPKGSNQEQSVPIMCNGNSHLLVTQNLFDFLNRWIWLYLTMLVSKGKDLGSKGFDPIPAEYDFRNFPTYLWVDALCIDQQDISERNAQVAMMDRIYESCAFCLVWLGNSDWLTDRGIEIITHISDLPVSRGMELKNLPVTSTKWLELLQMSEDDFVALWALFHRSWFHRAWIVQEIVLSPFSLWVSPIGILSFGMFSLTAKFLAATGLREKIADFVAIRRLGEGSNISQRPAQASDLISTLPQHAETGIGHSMYFLRDMVVTLQADKIRNNESLLQFLSKFRFTIATDPRDKIYAFAALAKRICMQSSGCLPMSFPAPDYSKPLAHVFLEACWYILSQSGSLELLLHIEDHRFRTVNDLPSWCPDWTHVMRPDVLTQGVRSGSERKPWSAAGPIRWRPSLEWGGITKRLQVQGWRVDSIVAVKAPFDGEPGAYIQWALLDMAAFSLNFPQVYPWSWGRTKTNITGEDFITGLGTDAADPSRVFSAVRIGLYNPRQSIEVPMAQSRTEALWRVMIADSMDGESPAPLNAGYGFGDFAYSGVHGIMVDLMTRRKCHDGQRAIVDDSLEKELKQNEYFRAHKSLRDSELNQRLDVLGNNDPLAVFKTTEAHQRQGLEQGFPPQGLGFVPAVPPRALWGSWDLHGEREASMVKFRDRMNFVSHGRCLLRTKTSLMGNGPGSTAAGDEVWILAGSTVPMVLRRLGKGTYKVVGPAYVHGIMHGEALRFRDCEMVSAELE